MGTDVLTVTLMGLSLVTSQNRLLLLPPPEDSLLEAGPPPPSNRSISFVSKRRRRRKSVSFLWTFLMTIRNQDQRWRVRPSITTHRRVVAGCGMYLITAAEHANGPAAVKHCCAAQLFRSIIHDDDDEKKDSRDPGRPIVVFSTLPAAAAPQPYANGLESPLLNECRTSPFSKRRARPPASTCWKEKLSRAQEKVGQRQ